MVNLAGNVADSPYCPLCFPFSWRGNGFARVIWRLNDYCVNISERVQQLVAEELEY